MPNAVTAPMPLAATISLVAASEAINGAAADDPERWEQGFAYAPESCGDAWIEDPCDVGARTPGSRPGDVSFTPFDVVASDRCSTFGFQQNDYVNRARRLIERCQSRQIAAEFWEGTQAQASGWSNDYLARVEADTVTGGAADAVDVLACLEQALASCGCGERGMIHATRQLVTRWAALGAGVLRREGSLLLTVHDTIVVSDAGYTGTGPNGEPATTSQWAFATGVVDVRLGPIDVVPSDLTGVFDSQNDMVFYAQRAAAATWDGCCHFAAEADLASCLVGGVS